MFLKFSGGGEIARFPPPPLVSNLSQVIVVSHLVRVVHRHSDAPSVLEIVHFHVEGFTPRVRRVNQAQLARPGRHEVSWAILEANQQQKWISGRSNSTSRHVQLAARVDSCNNNRRTTWQVSFHVKQMLQSCWSVRCRSDSWDFSFCWDISVICWKWLNFFRSFQ